MASTTVTAPAQNQPQEQQPGLVTRIREYFIELRAESEKVTWPTRDQVLATTAVVLACVAAFTVFFYVVDLAVGTGVKALIDYFSK
jgi:preprotein translocase subunit SecE